MSFATASIALMGVGAANSAIGSYYGAKNSKTQLAYQADVAEINARVAERAAQGELMRGEREQQNSRLKTAQLKSSQRVGMAANGLDLSSGTAQNILTSTDLMGEIDANTIAANAVRSAWGYRTQSTNDLNEAMIKRTTGESISAAGAAGSSLLTSGGQVASSWYFMNKGQNPSGRS